MAIVPETLVAVTQEVNGLLDRQNFKSTFLEELIPSGTVFPTLRSEAPKGFLICEGQAISRLTYSVLFAAIGTAYGAGDGSTTFNIPDMRGRVPVGKGTHASVEALGKTDEEATVANRRPKHTHTYSGTTSTGSTETPVSAGVLGVNINTHTHTFSGTTSENGPNFTVVNYMVKY